MMMGTKSGGFDVGRVRPGLITSPGLYFSRRAERPIFEDIGFRFLRAGAEPIKVLARHLDRNWFRKVNQKADPVLDGNASFSGRPSSRGSIFDIKNGPEN